MSILSAEHPHRRAVGRAEDGSEQGRVPETTCGPGPQLQRHRPEVTSVTQSTCSAALNVSVLTEDQGR